ncbi:MAG: GLPGLI family protein [Pedobacter sp.]|nr:MAG: GLPGLI family protein [Pedobacter sp.]
MKIKNLLTLCLTILVEQAVFAQNARFATSGVIEYEKRVNVIALIKEQLKRYPNDNFGPKVLEDYQRNNPQFKLLKSSLAFSKNETVFTPEPDPVVTNSWFDLPSAHQNNTIYTNVENATSVAQKKIFEETYLLKDSTRKITWKITDEFRNIAGYECRRANAVIMDSVYVVAFYTDEIPVSGGPESFTGLPGMILGVALPREHTTWFATAVTDQPVTADKLKIPAKGKPVDNKSLNDILKKALKGWGDSGQDILRTSLL